MYEIGLVGADEHFETLILPEALDMDDLMVIGAAKDHLAVGALAGHMEEDGLFIIDSLYVTPEERRRGAASEMLDTLISNFNNVDRGTIYRTDICEDDDEAESLISFFCSRGYAMAEGPDENLVSFTFFG